MTAKTRNEKHAALGLCMSDVLHNGYWTGRLCSRKAVNGDYCRQHAAKIAMQVARSEKAS